MLRLTRWFMAFGVLCAAPGFSAAPTTPSWLILYDSSGPHGWIGELHAKLLGNLLGHFPLSYTIRPVEGYRRADLNAAGGLFYLGTRFNNALPTPLLDDIMRSSKPVCWFKYNLWQLAWHSAHSNQFAARYGFRFDFMDASGFSLIRYKGESFSKSVLEPDIGRTTILEAALAHVPATAERPESATIPYVVRASNFWYVGDSPFTYMGEEDRYLVFADLLHDIVQIPHAQNHRALIRLEDVNPSYPPEVFMRAADVLAEEKVPFAVAVVPVYVDALGHFNNGAPRRVAMSEAPAFVDGLRYAQARGAQFVVHGYTHQYNAVRNPHAGVTTADYEFFRVALDAQSNVVTYAPVPEDSETWVRTRVTNALHEFRLVGLQSVCWETPHYAASPIAYAVFAQHFPLTMQRVLYFEPGWRSAGQFFPYIIERDAYGQKIMPENLGNVEPGRRTWSDIVRAARKVRVIRDGWAGAFFHPYLPLEDLRQLVRGIKALGYVYAPVAEPMAPVITPGVSNTFAVVGSTATLPVRAVGSTPLRYQWRRHGHPILNATNSILNLSNVQRGNTGNYTVSVSNASGSIVSTQRLTVVAPFLISHFSASPVGVSFSFASEMVGVYQVERAATPAGPWSLVQSFPGTGGVIQVRDGSASPANRFYRIRLE